MSLFDCGVCLDTASEPVVTFCGHLYCWACLYKWMQTSESVVLCPICKVPVTQDCIIPLYGRGRIAGSPIGSPEKSPAHTPQHSGSHPPRPRPRLRATPLQLPADVTHATAPMPAARADDEGSLAAAVQGMASSLLALQTPSGSSAAPAEAAAAPLSPEQVRARALGDEQCASNLCTETDPRSMSPLHLAPAGEASLPLAPSAAARLVCHPLPADDLRGVQPYPLRMASRVQFGLRGALSRDHWHTGLDERAAGCPVSQEPRLWCEGPTAWSPEASRR